jgi:hypothetical protein
LSDEKAQSAESEVASSPPGPANVSDYDCCSCGVIAIFNYLDFDIVSREIDERVRPVEIAGHFAEFVNSKGEC